MHQSVADESSIEPSYTQIPIDSSNALPYTLFSIIHHWSVFLVALKLSDHRIEGINHQMGKYAGNDETVHRWFLHKRKPTISKKYIFGKEDGSSCKPELKGRFAQDFNGVLVRSIWSKLYF